MPEQPVFFRAGDLRLEGMFSAASADRPLPGAVICHPHPVYGGTMDNNVVMAVAHALQAADHATLRFNFRGVGQSEGRYADGVGEAEDVRAAIGYLKEKSSGDDAPIILAGYSFGAWVSARVLDGDRSVSHLILVAPPTAMFDFSTLVADTEERARHVIVGERDQFCDRDALQQVFDRLSEPKTMRVIPHADHFFFGRERALTDAVNEIIADHV
jgi:alpha/beta superfamily hydrolase